MKQLFNNKLFWVIFFIISAAAAWISYRYFPVAYPIVQLDVTMDRSDALKSTRELSAQLNLAISDSQETAVFHTNELVQTFVELEAGGKEQFVAMMKNNLYQPYTWQVRQFKEYDPHELLIRFTPQGTPYGFIETISENEPGAQLDSAAAHLIALNFAQQKPWNINFDEYKQVEASHETVPSERVDHTFLFERPDIKIGDGFYRLQIKVSGDHVSELTHFVKVPETFIRKYQNMRSANEQIAYLAQIALMLLYVIGGCVFGLFYLFKERFVLWKPALWAALFIAGLTTLEMFNQLPIRWMDYNTAHSSIGFLCNQLISFTIAFIYWVFLLFLSFAAAESLTRKAFGNQLQLWSVWKPAVASSWPVLRQTVTAYLMTPLFFLYNVFFYMYVTKNFGWWWPANKLIDPNILATYIPWWQSITISLKAGFWEECLFRAVPLSCGALIGQRFGKRNWGIAIAFIIQMIVFSGAHANYPAQPAYARLVELLFVSALFGFIYLRVGLLPAAITHFIYDVFWFSLPIFVVHTPQARLNQIAVILLTLIPVWIILFSRLKTGAWHKASDWFYNFAWQPSAPVKKVIPQFTQQSFAWPRFAIIATCFAGFLGLGLWIGLSRFKTDGLTFTTTRTEALQKSNEIVSKKNVEVTNWDSIAKAVYFSGATAQQRFVWQKGGKKSYHQLLGSYLMPAVWLARYVKFNGPLDERAEEHHVYLNPDGSLYRYAHVLPENKEGESVDKQTAKAIALAAIFKQHKLQPDQLREISAVEQKRPHRLDWVFTFETPEDNPLETGQTRVRVTIAGNRVLDVERYVHVPEPWQRADDNFQFLTNMIKQVCALLLYLLIILGSIFLFIRWHIKIYARTLALFTFAIAGIFLFELINAWPAIVINFNTSQPFSDQLFRAYGMQLITLGMRAGLLGLLFCFTLQWRNYYRTVLSYWPAIFGLSIGSFAYGMQSFLEWLIPALKPLWPNYTPLAFMLPLNAGINTQLLNFISLTILLLLLTILFSTLSNGYQKHRIIASCAIILFGVISMGIAYADNIPLWLATGLGFGIVYLISYACIVRYSLSVIPFTTASYFILYAISQGIYNAFPYAILINSMSCLLIALLATVWSYQIQRINQ